MSKDDLTCDWPSTSWGFDTTCLLLHANTLAHGRKMYFSRLTDPSGLLIESRFIVEWIQDASTDSIAFSGCHTSIERIYCWPLLQPITSGDIQEDMLTPKLIACTWINRWCIAPSHLSAKREQDVYDMMGRITFTNANSFHFGNAYKLAWSDGNQLMGTCLQYAAQQLATNHTVMIAYDDISPSWPNMIG